MKRHHLSIEERARERERESDGERERQIESGRDFLSGKYGENAGMIQWVKGQRHFAEHTR